MPEEVEPTFTFTAEQLREAVSCYDLLLPEDIASAYAAMLEVPEFGLKVAQALQLAAESASKGKMDKSRILDAAVVPAFLIGMLVGRGRVVEPE